MTNNKPMGVVPWRPGRGSSRPRTADDVFAALAPETAGPAGRIVGRFRGFRIDSGFQPVVSLAHRRIVGHEALLRATAESGAPAAPVDVFAQARNTSDVVQLDRLCRAVHLFNYRAEAPEQGWLFLNVSPEVVVNGARFGAFFDELLHLSGMPPHRVVIEIIESAISDERQLARSARFYHSLGCLVAVDDFGAGHSNFERIARLQPEIVKLDRQLVVEAVANPRARRLVSNIVALLHEAGSLVLLEGVETQDQATLAMEADCDFVQGYFFGRPMPGLVTEPPQAPLDSLCLDFRQQLQARIARQTAELGVYRARLAEAAGALEAGADFDRACRALSALPAVRRSYLLDHRGRQVGDNIETSAAVDARYAPVAEAAGANWFRRPYFRQAITHPRLVQQTRPYLSVTDARLCVTLSFAWGEGGDTRVLCCDLDWSEEGQPQQGEVHTNSLRA